MDREQLGDIQGRSRQKQMEMAEEYGIEDYPSPAGGCCYLTDANFGRRILDFFEYEGKENLTMDDVMLLKIGRHFRVKPDVKVVMGREEGENKFLERYTPGRWRLETKDVTGPTTLVEGDPTDDDLRQIAGMTVGYAGLEGRCRHPGHLPLRRCRTHPRTVPGRGVRAGGVADLGSVGDRHPANSPAHESPLTLKSTELNPQSG